MSFFTSMRMKLPPYFVPCHFLTPQLTTQILNVIDVSFGRRVSLQRYDNVVMTQRDKKIAAVITTRHDPDSHWVFLENFCVLPNYRNQGLGTELLEFTCTELYTDYGGNKVTFALHVDAGINHDRLVNYYCCRGFRKSYTNEKETMLLSED